MTSCFLTLGTASWLLRAVWVPASIVYWLIVVFRSSPTSVRRSSRCQRGSHRKCRSPHRSPYLVRLDYRLLVFTAYQIAPSWAYVFHATDPWLCRFVRSVGSFNQLFFSVRTSIVRTQYFFYPQASCDFLRFLLIVACLFLVAMSVGYKLAVLRYQAHFSKSSTEANRVRVSVPTNFRLRGRTRSRSNSKRRQSKAVYTSVQRVFVSETNLEDIPSVDNFDQSRLCVVDNCANAHIWNTKDDFESGSLRPIGRLSQVATIGGSNFYPESVGRLPITWKDSDGNPYSIVLEDVLYFPRSPVNVVSITGLANQLDDDVGTYIKTSRKVSEFVWDREAGRVNLFHGSCQLPEMLVNEGFRHDQKKVLASLLSKYEPNDCCSRHSVLPEDVIDVNSAGVVPKLAVLFNNAKIDSGASVSGDETPFTSRNPFQSRKLRIGDTVRYVKNGHSELCTVDAIDMADLESPVEYTITLDESRNTLKASKENLQPLGAADVSDVALSEGQAEELIAALQSWNDDSKSWTGPVEGKLLQEFKAWHNRLNHLPFNKMFKLCEDGVLPKRFLKLKNQSLICPSCVISKMKRKPWRAKGGDSHIRRLSEACPGGCVSIDHMVSKQPGLVPRQDGRHSLARVEGATVYVDNDSEFGYSHFQTSLDLDQTVASKTAFERVADSYDVKVQRYLADNGIFAKNGFKDAVEAANQSIRFCATNAHNQNGIVERKIGLWTNDARTLLIHAQRHWPEMITTVLWPYAWKAVEYRDNIFGLNRNGDHPIQAFCGAKLPFNAQLKDQHTWGCPVFVLESKAANHMMPKWDPKGRVGIYLGHSPSHAGTVALVLNPRTLHVSPQYHVVFDDEFSTVPYMRKSEMPPNWTDLVVSSREKATDEDFELATRWATESTLNEDVAAESDPSMSALNEGDVLPMPLPQLVPDNFQNSVQDPPAETREAVDDFVLGSNSVVDPDPFLDAVPDSVVDRASVPVANSNLEMPTLANLNDLSRRKSSRTPKPSQKAKESGDKTVKKLFGLCCFFPMVFYSVFMVHAHAASKSMPILEKAVFHAEKIHTLFDGSLNGLHHAYLSTVDNGTYTLRDMLKQEDKAEFIKAMEVEVNDHESRNHWTLMPCSNMPSDAKTILAIWSFKRKLYPDGSINKYKARLCAHGGMQTWGENYWETYAPVVNWMSVRILFALSVIHDLDARSVDFVLAFPQAPLDIDVFMELPYGFSVEGKTDGVSKGYVLKLNKSLYGLKQAAFNWYEMLCKGLLDRGFKQSNADPCVFLRENCVIFCYVDDCIILSKKGTSVAGDLVNSLKTGPENFILEDEGSLSRYLGVIVDRQKDGKIHLSQPNLIKRFLALVNINEHENPKDTPAIKPMLHRDLDGKERRYAWNYRQAVGMLGYLQGSTRPDIATAVHQCARFCNDPRLSHERAIRRIGKYLNGNADKGIVLNPNPSLGLECFADADFAGNWNQADADNPENVFSRTGYVLRYAGCPVTWCSKLQTEIALSTAEAEYIALSQALREVIPTMNFLNELKSVIDLHVPKPEVFCNVFEDNTACIAMATSKKFTPRTKHIALKYHHFREAVNSGSIKIYHVGTLQQLADIFTKPLKVDQFSYLRMMLMGW